MTWPTILLQDARVILNGLTVPELIQLGQAIDRAIDRSSNPITFPSDQSHWIWSRVRPGWITEQNLFDATSIRETFSDLNVFLGLCEMQNIPIEPALKVRVDEWHLLAVIAIWKLIDARDIVFSESIDSAQPHPQSPEATFRKYKVGALAMEAQAAIGVAILRLEESRGRSQIAKKGGKKRNQLNNRDRDEAVRLANSRPFALKKLAVIFIQESIVKGVSADGSSLRYSKAVIARWLTKANWKASKVIKTRK
jgi:hypothetical protein